jgi:hypothetical protein
MIGMAAPNRGAAADGGAGKVATRAADSSII